MKEFIIEKGNHYCNGFWKKFLHPRWGHEKWGLTFMLPKENWHPSIAGETINKLYGCGFGFNHHKNSWRLGWKYNFNKKYHFWIYAYIYDETGSHIAKKIGEVSGGKYYDGMVESMSHKYWFTFLSVGDLVTLPNNHKDCKLQWDLNPYHGGHNVAPQRELFYIDYKPL